MRAWTSRRAVATSRRRAARGVPRVYLDLVLLDAPRGVVVEVAVVQGVPMPLMEDLRVAAGRAMRVRVGAIW